MYIKDSELINTIDALFEKKIIIYGVGKYGRGSASFLEKAGVEIYFFCDRDAGLKQYLGHQVITLDELEVIVKKEDCMIVVGSEAYCDEIIEELAEREVKAYICTWYGLQAAIEINIDDVRFLRAFQEEFKRKKELFNLLNHNSYNKSMFMNMCRISPPILVYLPGKVGSTEVVDALLREGLSVVHTHHMCFRPDEVTETAVLKRAEDFFKKQIKAEGCKIITLVREPIARALSSFMRRFTSNMYLSHHIDSGRSLAANAVEYIVDALDTNFEFIWFDKELKEMTGIDIYQYPFDKEKGYARIKEGNIDILAMTAEKLDENAEVIGEFVGKHDIKLKRVNIGNEKHYKYIYEGLRKDIRLPARVIESQYKNNPLLDHFYTEEEKERFLQKWSRYVSD